MPTDDVVPGCYSCDRRPTDASPARDAIVHTAHWNVAHAFNATLPGWLVLLPTRHVTAFTDLSREAADELGGLVRRLSSSLEAVTGCTRTYLMQFSEAEGFSHLHVHLVPRMPDQPAERLGPRVFGYLSDDKREWLPESRRDDLALQIRDALRHLPG